MTERADPDHPVCKCVPGQKEAIRKVFGFPDEKSLNDAIDHLDEWVHKQTHFIVKDLGRDYLETYLITAKGYLEKAKKRLDQRFTLRKMVPELFSNIDIDSDFVNLRKACKHASMPVPNTEYFRVLIGKFISTDTFDMVDYGRFVHVVAEYMCVTDYVLGYEGIVDLREVSLVGVLSKLNPLVLRKVMAMMVEGYGAKIKATHVICESKFVDKIVLLLKQGMSEKLAERIHIHSTPDTLIKYIPKECLPSDYGGTQKSIEELDDIFFQQLRSDAHKARMKIVETYATDESKRISAKFNEEYLGMPGSFKTLNVD